MDASTAATAASTASSILADRSDAMVILIVVIGMFAFWMWKVHIPRMESQRKLHESDKEIHRTNAETLAKLGDMTSGIHQTSTHKLDHATRDDRNQGDRLDCLSKVSEAAKCDLRNEIAEAKGVLRAVKAGVTE